MILGIDVGGTHTDAVLLGKHQVLATSKVQTQHNDLLASVREVLDEINSKQDLTGLQRFNLSTTLCTNAIVEHTLEEVGVMVIAGPGINPSHFSIGNNYRILRGGLDHRGTEIIPLNLDDVSECIQDFLQLGLRVFSVIGKFSPRNPAQERQVAEFLGGRGQFITQGHTLSAQLNFPRRIATAYYNSAVWPIFNRFADCIADSMQELNLQPHLNILKADGGTMPFAQARQMPVESIFSGPAASIMGILALCGLDEDSILLDIGGTTTDMAVFAGGVPLIEPENVELEHRPTLVRAMKAKSVGLGGDSQIQVEQGELKIGPKRLGPCMAKNGPAPTPMDAVICLNDLGFGEPANSWKGMQQIAKDLGVAPKEAAERIIGLFSAQMKKACQEMLHLINERPIYTVHELLKQEELAPRKLYLMGGPAEVLAPFLSRAFDLPAIIPEHYAVANALGAAVARPTKQAELLADTEKGFLVIPELDIYRNIPPNYNLEQAKDELKQNLCQYASKKYDWHVPQDQVEITECSSMHMVKDMYSTGLDIRVKCQIKPGITTGYETAVRCICKER